MDNAFTPGKGKLTRLFIYILQKSQHFRPPGIPEAQWQYALQLAGGPDNAAGRWPVAVQGLGQLKLQRDAQKAGAEAIQKYLDDLQAAVHRLQDTKRHELQRRVESLLTTHSQLAHRLLKVRLLSHPMGASYRSNGTRIHSESPKLC
jgi:hypothetical protein